MNPKTTLILVVALFLAVVGVWFAQPGKNPTDEVADTGPKKLFDMMAADINAFEIKQGDQSTYSFIREDNKWKMTAPIAGAAEQFAVNGEVGKILGLEYTHTYNDGKGESISDELTSLNRPFKIAKLTDKDGKSHVVKIGAGQKLSSKTYVQIEGDPKVYLVSADLAVYLNHDPTDFRGKRVAEFKTAEAVKVQVSGSENFTLAKSDQGWTIESPVKARADLALVNKILNGVANLSALQFVEDDPKSLRPFGLENPRLVVTITTEHKTPKDVAGPTSQPEDVQYAVETSTLSLELGGAAEDRLFAKMAEPASPAVFQVNQSLLADLGPAINDLRDKRIAAIDINRANKIEIMVGGESVTLIKVDSQWKIAGPDGATPVESAEYAAVDDLLKALRDAKALGFEDAGAAENPSYGFDSPRATMEVSIVGKTEPVKLRIGALTPSKTGVYVRNENDNTVAVILTATAESLAVRPITFRSREILRFDSSNATRIQIVRDGFTRTVQRKIADWTMTEPIAGGVELQNLEKILADLSGLNGRRVVAPASDAAAYGLTDAAMKVSVTLTPPAPASQPADMPTPTPIEHTILIARGADKVYAMKVGADLICEVDAKIADDMEAELLDTRLLKLQPSTVQEIAFGGAQTFTLEKKDDAWKLVGEATFPIDPAKVTTLLNALRDLHTKRYVSYAGGIPGEFLLDKPEITIAVRDDQGEAHTLQLSSKIPTEGGRYASLAAHPDRIFVVGPDDFTKLSRKVTDFQKP